MTDDIGLVTHAPVVPAANPAPLPTRTRRGEVQPEEARALRVGCGTLVWSLRTQAGLTQAQLAQRAGMSEWTVRELEHGRVRPSDATCAKLAAGLHQHADPIRVVVADLDLQAAAGPSLQVCKRPTLTRQVRKRRSTTQRRRQRREREAALVCATALRLIKPAPEHPVDCERRPAARTDLASPGGLAPRQLPTSVGGVPGHGSPS